MKNLRSRLLYAAIVVIVFAFIDQYSYFLKLIGWKQYISEWLYVLAIRNAFEVGTCVIALTIMANKFMTNMSPWPRPQNVWALLFTKQEGCIGLVHKR